MTTEFLWRLPVGGDGRFGNAAKTRRGERDGSARPAFSSGVSDPRGDKFNYFDYLHQIARAADLAGFDGLQIPDDPSGDESWIVAGYVARDTRHLKLVTEFEASRGSAVYAAKNAASYQRFSGGRFAWQIARGGAAQQRGAHGDNASDSDLLPRIEEFVTVARGVLTQAPFSFRGRFFEVLNGGFRGPLANLPVPQVYLSGDDDAALRLSARVADVHVFQALPAEQLRARIDALRSLAEEHGRTVSAALRIDLVARETQSEALFDARRFLEQSGGRGDAASSRGQSNLWSGLSTHQTGATASLVGSYEQVVADLSEYARLGIQTFVLAAVPHFEEAYRIGEHVLPALRSATTSPRQLAA